MASLKEKTLSGIFWSFLQKVGDRGIAFFISIILARILMPEDFGLIGMLSVFIAISETLVEAGFNKALIQKKDTDEEDYSTVFFINLIVSVCIYWILYISAPYIANFYNEESLTKLTRVLSLIFILNAFGYVQVTKLTKELQFKKLMLIHLPSTLISGIVAVIMAYNGFGVWSLVGQRLTMRFVFIIQVWLYSRWKPLWVFNKDKAKQLFSFGGNLMLVGLIQTIYSNGYKIIIGKFYPAKTLGYYENANTLVSTPISTLSSVMASVAFPIFSSIQDDNHRLKIGYKKSIQQVFFIISPLLILSMAVAEPMFRFLLTEKWLPAVPFYQILCVGFIFRPLNQYNIDMLNVKGQSRLFLKLDIIKKIIETIGIVVSILYFDIWVLIWFQSLFTFGKYLINSYYSGKLIDYSITEQLKDIIGILLASSVIGLLVYYLNIYILFESTDIIRLLISTIIALGMYWGLMRISNHSAYVDFVNIIKPLIKKIKI